MIYNTAKFRELIRDLSLPELTARLVLGNMSAWEFQFSMFADLWPQVFSKASSLPARYTDLIPILRELSPEFGTV
jgi:hypothetical protein